MFSGFRLEQLRRVAKRNRHVSVSLALTDVLIDGLFREAERDCDGMRGSANQRIHFLSGRYVDQRDKFERYDRERMQISDSLGDGMLVGIPKTEAGSGMGRICTKRPKGGDSMSGRKCSKVRISQSQYDSLVARARRADDASAQARESAEREQAKVPGIQA